MEPINLSIIDAAHALGVGRSKLYELIGDGHLETVKLGTRRLVRVASLRKFSDNLAKRVGGSCPGE